VQSFKVLLVDDFEGFRKFVCSLVQQRAEFQITQASDGLEAVRKAEEQQPDLILLDIGLPNLNGMEVARRVRKLAPHAKILFLSQEFSSAVVEEAIRLGALGYVQKTRAQRELLPAIDAVLRGMLFVSGGLGGGTFDSGIAADHRFRHEVQFYSDESILLESLTRFIAAALRAGNPAIVLATKSHREVLVERLKTNGFDIDGAIQQGTYVSLDAASTLSTITVKGVPDRGLFFEALTDLIRSAAKAAKTAPPRVAICGEGCGLLCTLGNTKAAISLEKVGNDLGKTQNIDILCAYPLPCCQEDTPAFNSICAEHTAIYSR